MNTLPSLPCYLNGEFTELPDAKISVMDRGFIFGDGVYEVVPVYGGRLFRFEQHMARLNRSLTEVRIANPMTQAQWGEVALKLVSSYADHVGAKAENINQLIYIQITRGVAMRDHVMPTDITPTVFVMANKMNLPTEAQRSQGVACVTADDFRWEKAHIKSTSLLGSVLARQISFDAGALETIMFRDGFLSEAAASNVWVVKGGKVLGTPKDNLVLEGIRYRLLEEICRSKGIAFELRRVSREEVLTADELLLSSATKEVLAVTQLDGQPVGQGKPGPVYAQLYAGYQKAKEQV
jgi:D-alanine transaminase